MKKYEKVKEKSEPEAKKDVWGVEIDKKDESEPRPPTGYVHYKQAKNVHVRTLGSRGIMENC